MIIDHFRKSDKPQSETVQFFKDKYAISTSSFSDWLKSEDELRRRLREATQTDKLTGISLKSAKRRPTYKYKEINEAMHRAVEERRAQGLAISESYLRQCWVRLAPRCGIDDPKRRMIFSHGWLSNFKKRHGLTKRSLKGVRENGEEAVEEEAAVAAAVEGRSPNSPATSTSGGSSEANSLNNNVAPTQSTSVELTGMLARQTGPYDYSYENDEGREGRSGQGRKQQGMQIPRNPQLLLQNQLQGQLQRSTHMQSVQAQATTTTQANSQPPINSYMPLESRFSYGAIIGNQQPPQLPSFSRQIHHSTATQLTSSSTQPPSQETDLAEDGTNQFDRKVDIQDMEKFIFIYSERFFLQYGYQFRRSHELFNKLKSMFMEEKFANSSRGSAVDELFGRRRA
ncbi:DEKNAAC105434 [Brettanomyces naardenensis]|uniref:DEKNAAC105434 n=1 Tax=Brettanomyces naardenensis TaxID=13370 RepID=A0A448YT74_BRENA|nr:DEKNAAC105434 [Brettanomyces naardenensis]